LQKKAVKLLRIMNPESPVTLYKIHYRGSIVYHLKWAEGRENREASFPSEEEAVMETTVIEERLRVASLAGQGLTVNPFGMHTPYINSKDVNYAALKLQPRGFKFREVIDEYVTAVTALKPYGTSVSAAVASHVEACLALKPYDTTPQQALFEWLEVKKQIGDKPFFEVLRGYLQAKTEQSAEPPPVVG
jgi:hypothetical protein